MTLSEYAVHKKVGVVMLTMGIILVGVISFVRIPQELFPPITFPQVTVVTDYANAAPEEIETLITKPIEEAVGSVAGLKRIESVSQEGRSNVQIAFNWGQDIEFAALAVREKIDLVKERLPKEASDPIVLKFDPLSRPILMLSVTGNNIPPVRLKILAEKMIKDNLEKVEGVASVNISGGEDREIQVEVDQARLDASHLSLLELVQSIEDTNVSYPAGSIKKGLYEYLIRTVGEFRSVKEVEYTVVGVDNVQKLRNENTSFVERDESEGPRDTLDTLRQEVKKDLLEKRLVLVRDVAAVTDGTAEQTSVSRYNGKANISLAVQKQANANTIRLVKQLRKALDALKEDLNSRGIQCDIIYDHSVFIKQSIDNLMHEALTGAFYAFLVLLFFLRSFIACLVVTLSIPITILGVFFMMSAMGISINMMSLQGLTLSIGMIVDTSIVVVENIFRHRQMGADEEEGAIRGTDEVTWAVIGSNLTTVAVYFPLLIFVPGIMGQIIKDLSWTIIFSQIVSTIIPLTLIPMLSVLAQIRMPEYKPMNWTTQWMDRKMDPSLPPAKHQAFISKSLLIIFGVIIFTIFTLLPKLDREVLPKVDQGQFLVKLTLPIGTRLDITDRISRRIEDAIRTIPEVKDVALTIGAEKSKAGEIKVETLRSSQAIVLVTLNKERKRPSTAVVEELRGKLQAVDLEEARLEFILQESELSFAQGGAKPILIEIKGYDLEKTEEISGRIKKSLGQIAGVMDIQDDMGEAVPETKLNIDKKRAALYGISALDISLTAKAAIEGVVATQYREAGKEYDIRVRLSEKDRNRIDNLGNLLLYSKVLDQVIPLKEVAEVSRGLGPSEIRHINQERTTTVSADIGKNVQSKDVLARVQQMLRHMDVPGDFQVVLSGKAKEIKESYSLLLFAFILSIILNYMIMASLFESFVQPLIIMVTVPLAFFGIILSLYVTHTSINLISLIGITMLGGVVVNNGIVLIEFINQTREEGAGMVEATLRAVRVRARPIFMSSLTSIVALIPMALGFGEGAELGQPMAITVMGGLISSTILTLGVIPLLYVLTEYITSRFVTTVDEDALVESEDA